jgi:LysM repeat protein
MAEKVTVKSGQTLSSIAKANNTTVAAIKEANPVLTTNPKYQGGNVIFSGTKLNVPTTMGPTGPIGATGSTGVTGPTLVTSLTPEQIAAQLLAAQNAANAANAAEAARIQAAADAEARRRAGQSAYDILLSEFNQYGLGALVEPLKGLIQSGPSSAELTLALRATDAYQKRFAANKSRVSAGLSALNEAEYIRLEDQYQNVMRNYGLPKSYYTKDTTGRQEGFEKLIGFDVSATELEDRVLTAQNRVINAAPEITTALKQFYPDITNGDILAYTLDPTKGLSEIKRKVTAAEIGGAAIGAGLGTGVTRAEQLATYGVTAESARQGYGTIGAGLERGRQLSSIYQQPDYNQAVAEEELFNLPGQTQAGEKRKKIIGLEKATFGGQTGVTSGALSQNRAGSY